MLLTPSLPPIELPVADRQVQDTRIRQRARFAGLQHISTGFGGPQVLITVQVQLFAADGAGYGDPLAGAGLSAYQRTLSADNSCLVEAATGRILAVRVGENDADWQAKIDALSQSRDTMLQGDFFEYLRDTQPVKIGDMIRQYIQQADAAGKFA